MSDYFPSNYYQSLLNEFYWNLIEGRRLTQYMRRHNRGDRERENAEWMENTEEGAAGHSRRKTPSPSRPIQMNMENREEIINEIKAMNFNYWWSPYKIVRDVSCQVDFKHDSNLSSDVLTFVEMEAHRPQIPPDCQREVGTQVMWSLTDDDQIEWRESGDTEISPRHDDSYRNQSATETQTHNDQPESSNAQPRIQENVPIFNGDNPAWSREPNDPMPRLEVFGEFSGASSQVNGIYSQEIYQPNQPYPFSRGYCHNFPLMTFRPLPSFGGFQRVNTYMPPDNFPRFPLPHWNYHPQPTCFYDPYSRRPLAYILPGRPLMLAQNIGYLNPLLPTRPLQVNNQILARNNAGRWTSRPETQPQYSTNKNAQISKDILPKKNGKKRDA